jgi:hypothetical protein
MKVGPSGGVEGRLRLDGGVQPNERRLRVSEFGSVLTSGSCRVALRVIASCCALSVIDQWVPRAQGESWNSRIWQRSARRSVGWPSS